MNPLSLCLSISPLTTVSTPPLPVASIVQSHVIQQLRQRHPELRVNFDNASCPNVIHYENGLAALKIFGQAGIWQGEKQIAYTDALAGRRLDFSQNLLELDVPLSAAPPPSLKSESSPSWRRWLLWTGVGIVATGVAYRIYDSRQQNSGNRTGSSGLQHGIRL
jgi:hypothetical protein